MLMPETAMNENSFPAGRKNKIGLPGKVTPVQPVTETHTVGNASDDHFGLHALAPDGSHVFCAFLRRNFIHRPNIPQLVF